MVQEDAFRVEGRIVEVLSSRTYRVELANGHRLLGFVPRSRSSLATLAVGDRVKLQMSPYDLSEGRILEKNEAIWKNESSRVR